MKYFFALAFGLTLSGFLQLRNVGQAPSPAELAPLLVVSTPEDGVRLTCESGCAWTELSFAPALGNVVTAVDEFGMTSEDRQRQSERTDLSEFLFTVRRTQDGVELEGLEGFAWTQLRYTCPEHNCSIPIDRRGMR